MRTRKATSVVIILFSFFAFANEEDRINEIWIDGSTFYTSIKHEKKSTIYFKTWSHFVHQLLLDENYYIALQLDRDFDPIPSDNLSLPDLATLSTITNDKTLLWYLEFYVDFNRTKGITHLILPDTSQLNKHEREVVVKANHLAPYFFLYPSLLSYNLPDTKRDFLQKADKRTVYLAKQDVDTKKLERWSEKLIRKQKDPFLRSLRDFKKSKFTPVNAIPQDLNNALFESTITAIDPDYALPVTSRHLTYLGCDQNLKSELSRYFVILDERSVGVPALVDIRTKDFIIEGSDILLTNKFTEYKNASINVLHEVTSSHKTITKIILGSQTVTGRSPKPGSRHLHNYEYLTYSEKGLPPSTIRTIDSIMSKAINNFATPGGQIMIVKGKEILFEKSYGFYTYDSIKKVSKNTLYDIASLTKVTATLPAIALLIDQEKLSLDDSIGMYLDVFKHSNKSGITIKQLLAHQGGLKPYVPFWKMAIEGDRLDAFYYKTKQDEEEDRRSYGFEPDPILLDTLKNFLIKSELIEEPEQYSYSDLGFMILHMIVEKVADQSLDSFVYENFYKPMGLHYSYFNPLDNGFDFENIAPTEYDLRYRNYQVWGEVHDRNALVFGGVSGHAGLFSNAGDIAKLMYMFLRNGYYGGRSYISPQTLYSFNQRYFDNNRRGLGWDKKDQKKQLLPSKLASDQSFGHTGFTGTMAWVDPKHELIFVFLSNRIYPDAENWKLNHLQTRTNIHHALYESLIQGSETYLTVD